jgi:hypothetical protein
VQSTPAGGLRDRQVPHGESVPQARWPVWSRLSRTKRAMGGVGEAGFGSSAPCPELAGGEDPGGGQRQAGWGDTQSAPGVIRFMR